MKQRQKLKPGKIWALRFGIDNKITDLILNPDDRFFRRTFKTKSEAQGYVRDCHFANCEIIRLKIEEV
jgi:hypothetical protein